MADAPVTVNVQQPAAPAQPAAQPAPQVEVVKPNTLIGVAQAAKQPVVHVAVEQEK